MSNLQGTVWHYEGRNTNWILLQGSTSRLNASRCITREVTFNSRKALEQFWRMYCTYGKDKTAKPLKDEHWSPEVIQTIPDNIYQIT